MASVTETYGLITSAEARIAQPMPLLERARLLTRLTDRLHSELLDPTMPDDAVLVLACVTARHANVILDGINKARHVPTSTDGRAFANAIDEAVARR